MRDHDELTGRDLLRALIACSNQLEDRNIHSLLSVLRPQIQFADQLANQVERDRLAPPVLSAEVYRVMQVAMREAGADRKITNFDLLIGLAECRQEFLTEAGITTDEIRQGQQDESGPQR